MRTGDSRCHRHFQEGRGGEDAPFFLLGRKLGLIQYLDECLQQKVRSQEVWVWEDLLCMGQEEKSICCCRRRRREEERSEAGSSKRLRA